ncbi:MAG: exosortase/archaeosortase family protein, partial [Candidatus Bathyarchaeia archaeon]
IIISVYNLRGLAGLFAPSLFLGSIGFIFLIDWAFPESSFGPFKALVRPTATAAAIFLDAMGYKTQLIEQPSFYGPITGLIVSDPNKNLSVGFGIAWPCAGVESLFLYTVTLLLFLQTFRMAKKRKLIYFIIGAIVTYLINILRIVTIYIIALNKGDWGTFHSYYGWLYSFLWIAAYPLIILMIQTLSNKNKKESAHPLIVKG